MGDPGFDNEIPRCSNNRSAIAIRLDSPRSPVHSIRIERHISCADFEGLLSLRGASTCPRAYPKLRGSEQERSVKRKSLTRSTRR